MAGGYHLFSSGEVLTAANANNFLMNQTTMVFASASARTSALTGVLAEGMVSYRTDSHVFEMYNGSAWVYPPTYPTVNAQTGTTYVTVLSDANNIVTLNNASAIAVTIPTNASVAYTIGTQITFAWITGAGQPTISAVTPGTTTIISTGATAASPKLRVVNSAATATKIATDIWLVNGDIA